MRDDFLKSCLWLSPIILLVFLLGLEGGEGKGSIKLSVTDANRVGIPAASITVEDSNGKIICRTQTDQNGSVLITLPKGSYTLRVEKEGYTSRKLKIVIAGGEIVQKVVLSKGRVLHAVGRVGLFPGIIRYGKPKNGGFILKMKNPPKGTKFSLIQLGEESFLIGRLPYQLKKLDRHQRESLKRSTLLRIEEGVPCSQIVSVLSMLYDFYHPKRFYLAPAFLNEPSISFKPVGAESSVLFVSVDDCSSESISEPISGATVEIRGAKSDKGNTDSNGMIQFPNIPPGEYTVKVSKEGYRGQSLKVMVDPKRVMSLFFHLVKVGKSGAKIRSLVGLPYKKLKLTLPIGRGAAISDNKHGILFLYRSGEMLIESGGIGQMIGSLNQFKHALSQLHPKRLFIVADETTTGERLLGVMKYAAEVGFREFSFVVEYQTFRDIR